MEFNRKAHPNCIYSNNPFHECASACLEKIAQNHGKKKTKASKILSFGRKKKESNSQPLSPLSAKPYQNGGGGKVHHLITSPVAKKSFSSSSSGDPEDFFKHKPEKKVSQIIPISRKYLVSSKPEIQEHNDNIEATDFNVLSTSRSHEIESSDDYNEEDTNEIGVELDLESVMSDTFVSVGNYRVRSGSSTILTAIIEKHGDIAQNSKLESESMLSRYLECLCSLMQELRSTPVGQLTKVKVKEMLAVLKDLESVNIEVDFLRLVLEEFAQSQENVQTENERYNGLMKAKREEIEERKAGLVRLEEEVSEARLRIKETQDEIVEMEKEWSKMANLGFKMESFKGKAFIDELL